MTSGFQMLFLDSRKENDSLLLTSGKTCSGSLLSEADLISTMDKNGIGTDATIHDHIQTILNRGYVLRRPKDRRFEPSPLGIALIKGFDAIPLGNNVCLSKPELRKKMEHDMKEICLGQKQPRLVLEQNIRLFIFIYNKLKENMHILENAFSNLVTAVPASSSRQGQTVNRFTNTSHRDDDPSDSENDKFNAHNGRKSYYSNIPRKRIGGLFETPNSTTIEEPIRCDCGLEAKVSVAKTGENDGREYATCVKSGARCKFWLWLDGQPSKKPATTHSKGPSTTSHTRTYKSKKF